MYLQIPDVTAMEKLAGRIALLAEPPFRVYLQGNLGAGKTTFVRGFLRQLGYKAVVKSPTYTLVEPYVLAESNPMLQVYHFDLYRLNTPEELEDIGLRDYLGQSAIYLVEWPEKAASILEPADLFLRIEMSEKSVTERKLHLQANTSQGEKILQALAAGH